MKQILLIFIIMFLVLSVVFFLGTINTIKEANKNLTSAMVSAGLMISACMCLITSAIFFIIALSLIEIYLRWHED